jgi:hypothetical protein
MKNKLDTVISNICAVFRYQRPDSAKFECTVHGEKKTNFFTDLIKKHVSWNILKYPQPLIHVRLKIGIYVEHFIR